MGLGNEAENVEAGAVKDFTEAVIANVEKVIVGKRPAIEAVLIALLCEGHVLIEDAPGTGKTMLARAVAITTGLEFKRLQCTPDLLPNDVTKSSVSLNSDQGLLSAISSWPMRSIALPHALRAPY